MRMTMRRFNIHIEGFKKAQMRKDDELWLQGLYDFRAYSAALSNFGAGLNGKRGKAKYPDKPFLQEEEERKKAAQMTEEERIEGVKALFASLGAMQKKFEDSKKSGQ